MEKNKKAPSMPKKNKKMGKNDPLPEWLKKDWVLITLSFGVLLFILLAIIFVYQVKYYQKLITFENGLNSAKLTEEMKKQPAASINSINNFHIGSENPEVTIVEFSDFSCPYCREMVPKLRKIMSAYPSKIKLVHKDFPVVNEEGLDFALAARCAGEQSEIYFWKIHDRLYSGQGAIMPEDLPRIAANIGLDMEKFKKCLEQQEPLDKIKADLREAEKLGVSGTPTIFINGHMVPGNMPAPIILKIVQEFLESGS